MDAPLPTQTVQCTQCGGELHPDEGQIFLTCPYCGAAVYLDKSQVVFHWYLAPTLDEAQAKAALSRWMAGNQTVKDLDQKSRLTGVQFEYFPVWYFKVRTGENKEEIALEPAAATSISELRHLRLPAGDLRRYDPDLDSQAHPPSVPLQAARAWLKERQAAPLAALPARESAPQEQVPVQKSPGEPSLNEQSLVHIPLYTFKYTYQGKTYTALVEAGTGGVFANLYPAKAEAPYLLAGGLAALTFLCLATFPLIGAVLEDEAGTLAGLGVCLGVSLLAGPLLFAVAAWVAAKI